MVLGLVLAACGSFGGGSSQDREAPDAATAQCAAGTEPCFEGGKTVCRDLANDGRACGACGHVCWDGPGALSPSCREGECGHVVFVSSAEYVGSEIGDLVGADQKCEALAAGRFGTGKFNAWLSTTRVHAGERTDPARGKGARAYILPDGTLIASSWAQFKQPDHKAPIHISETGADLSGASNPNVWTATDAAGSFVARGTDGDCNNWGPTPSTAARAGVLTESRASAWTAAAEAACNLSAHLYCVQE